MASYACGRWAGCTPRELAHIAEDADPTVLIADSTWLGAAGTDWIPASMKLRVSLCEAIDRTTAFEAVIWRGDDTELPPTDPDAVLGTQEKSVVGNSVGEVTLHTKQYPLEAAAEAIEDVESGRIRAARSWFPMFPRRESPPVAQNATRAVNPAPVGYATKVS